MKLFAIIPISSLLLAGFVHSESVSTKKSGALNDTTPQLTTEYIQARMDTITITDFNIEQAPLAKAIAYLDALLEPHGIQILYRPTEGREEPKVNLRTKSLSMSSNLTYLSAQGGYEWWVQDGIIIIGAPEEHEALVTEFIPIKSTNVRRFVENDRAKR